MCWSMRQTDLLLQGAIVLKTRQSNISKKATSRQCGAICKRGDDGCQLSLGGSPAYQWDLSTLKTSYEKSFAKVGRRVNSFSYHYFFFYKGTKKQQKTYKKIGMNETPMVQGGHRFMVCFKDGFPHDVLFANTRYVLGKGSNNQNDRWVRCIFF